MRWIKSSEEMRKNVFREPDVVIKAFSKRLESYILFYGILEIDSLYKEFCDNFQMEEKEDFYRCVYWHARFNNLVQTMLAIDGKRYVASTQLDVERIFLDMKKYADDLEYAFRPAKELEILTEDINGRSSWIEVLFVDLHFNLGFPAEEAGYIVEEIFETIMNGAVLSEVLGVIYALPRSDSLERACIVASEDLSALCEFWLCITGLMLELELPMLKGRSREEYAQETGISPWNVGMLEQKKISGNTKKRHMYEFPADVQERMYQAANYSDTEELKWLSKYKRDQKIKSEEFLALLADAYITCSEFGKASKLIDELEGSSVRARKAAQILKGRLEDGQDVMDEEDDFLSLPMDNWDFEPEYKQQPYVRETRKIGRNEPCPCGSGKKYKHCCGKK